jgi:pyridoxine/pyridoxamine 5'-phosphate oxidase
MFQPIPNRHTMTRRPIQMKLQVNAILFWQEMEQQVEVKVEEVKVEMK